jgi:ankyrin repeat protein
MGVSLDTMWQNMSNGDLVSFKATIDHSSIDVKDRDRLRTTILHRYAYYVNSLKYNPVEIVKLLIQKGMDINCSTNKIGHGVTALHIGVQQGSLALCQALLDQGADIDKVEIHGNTPLWFAVMDYIKDTEKYGKIIEYLLAKGADPNKENYYGHSPFKVALKLKGTDVIKYFQSDNH